MLGGYGPTKNAGDDQRYSPYDVPDTTAMALSVNSSTGATEASGRAHHMTIQGASGAFESNDHVQQLLTAMQTYSASAQARSAGLDSTGLLSQQQFCQFFQKAGWCRWGDSCRYVHSGGPERQVCQFFEKAGWCRWGDACRHIHSGSANLGMAPVVAPFAPGQQPVCQFFQKAGWCKFGDGCRYIHSGGPAIATKAFGETRQAGQADVCQFFQRTGWCKYGDNCRYAHIAGGTGVSGNIAAANNSFTTPAASDGLGTQMFGSTSPSNSNGSPLTQALAEFGKALSMVSQPVAS